MIRYDSTYLAINRCVTQSANMKKSIKKYEETFEELQQQGKCLQVDDLFYLIYEDKDEKSEQMSQFSLINFNEKKALQTKLFFKKHFQMIYYTNILRLGNKLSSIFQTNKQKEKTIEFSCLVEKFKYNPISDNNKYCFVLDCDISNDLEYFGFNTKIQTNQESFEMFKTFFIQQVNLLCSKDVSESIFFTRYPGYVYKNKFSSHIYVQCIQFEQNELQKTAVQNKNIMKSFALMLDQGIRTRYKSFWAQKLEQLKEEEQSQDIKKQIGFCKFMIEKREKEDERLCLLNQEQILEYEQINSIFDINIYDYCHLKSVFSYKTNFFDIHIPDQIKYFNEIRVHEQSEHEQSEPKGHEQSEDDIYEKISTYKFNKQDYQIFKNYFIQNSFSHENRLEKAIELSKQYIQMFTKNKLEPWKSSPANIQIFFNQITQLVQLDEKYCNETYYWKNIVACFAYIYHQEKQMFEQDKYFEKEEQDFTQSQMAMLLMKKVRIYSRRTKQGKQIYDSEHGEEYAFSLITSNFSKRLSPYYVEYLLKSMNKPTEQGCASNSFFKINDAQIDKYIKVKQINEQYISNIIDNVDGNEEYKEITDILCKSFTHDYDDGFRQMISFICSQPKTGKSFLFRRILEKANQDLIVKTDGITVLILTSSQTLALDLENQINNDNKKDLFHVVNYMDLHYDFDSLNQTQLDLTPEQKKQLAQEKQRRQELKQEFTNKTMIHQKDKINIVICGVLSLSHLSNFFKPDMVIIDEICKFNMQLCSKDFQTDRLLKNTPRLQKMLNNSQKIICLDGFLSYYDIFIFCEKMFPTLREYDIYNKNRVNVISNSYNPFKETLCTVTNLQQTMLDFMKQKLEGSDDVISVCVDNIALGNCLCEELKKYNPFFIRKEERVIENCNEENKQTTLAEYKKLYFGFMQAKEDDKITFLRDNKIRVLIYSPKITVGLNIKKIEHVYAFYRGTIHPKDMMQMIMRNRDMKTLMIDIQYQHVNKKFRILDPHDQYNCENIDVQDLYIMLSIFDTEYYKADEQEAEKERLELNQRNPLKEFEEDCATLRKFIKCMINEKMIKEETQKNVDITFPQFQFIIDKYYPVLMSQPQYRQAFKQLDLFLQNYYKKEDENIIEDKLKIEYRQTQHSLMFIVSLALEKIKLQNKRIFGDKKTQQILKQQVLFEQLLIQNGYYKKEIVQQADIDSLKNGDKFDTLRDFLDSTCQIPVQNLLQHKADENEELQGKLQKQCLTKVKVQQEIQANKLLYIEQIRQGLRKVMLDDFCPFVLITDFIKKNINVIRDVLETQIVNETQLFTKLRSLLETTFQDRFVQNDERQDKRMAGTQINPKYGTYTGKITVYKYLVKENK